MENLRVVRYQVRGRKGWITRYRVVQLFDLRAEGGHGFGFDGGKEICSFSSRERAQKEMFKLLAK